MSTTNNNNYTHSKALLSYLISTYSKTRQSTSPPQINATLQLERSLKRLAVEQARAASASAGTSEASGTDTEDEENSATTSSNDGGDELTEDDK